MLKTLQNINQGEYVPPGFGADYPSAPFNIGNNPATPPAGSGFYGFNPGNPSEIPSYGKAKTKQHDNQDSGGRAPHGGQNPRPNYGDGRYYPGPQPTVTQPGVYGGQGQLIGATGQPMRPPDDSMSVPTRIHNVPHGLEYLSTVNQLFVKQQIDVLEVASRGRVERPNKYKIDNAFGQQVYYAVEDTNYCKQNCCCASIRPFDIKIFDNYRNEVIHLNRPLACDSCCFPCCLQTMEISVRPGDVIGSIEQEWTICKPAYEIKDQFGDTVLRIEGPFCTCNCCCRDVEFNVVSLTGENVGIISKKWAGMVQEFYTDADFYGITFPMNLDVRIKAVLLGALILIDFMFFED